jgi:uncharacterized cupredoxin-like copper-binding protein
MCGRAARWFGQVEQGGVARTLAVVVAGVSLIAAAGCGGGAHAQTIDAVVPVELSNFKITVPEHVKPGVVKFVLRGVGPTMHEFNVVRTDDSAAALPLAADGTVDDQNPHPGFLHLAEEEGIDIGQRASLVVRMRPGHYVMYCNMDGHYQAGMRTEVTVS